jgi:NAD(P)-dependent dehydrogenase (short-subunit alcohol dehydrogenase family)
MNGTAFHGRDKDLDFSGKTILVTGSSRNIGRPIILEFAERGANVVINTRSNREEAEAVLAEAEALGARGIVVLVRRRIRRPLPNSTAHRKPRSVGWTSMSAMPRAVSRKISGIRRTKTGIST